MCTDFVLQAKDGTYVNGRSMEFALAFHSQILVSVRGKKVQSAAPDGKKGHSWTAKYGFLAVNGFGLECPFDGLNEEGLSFGALWLPEAKYQSVLPNESNRAIVLEDFGAWVLGNFATVQEVKRALPEIRVWGRPVAGFGGVPPVHFAIHDAAGAHLVVECIDGEMRIYDNPNSVLTNAPELKWHLENLRNYVNQSAVNAAPIKLQDSLVITPTGQGSGLLGIPGDWTPPSRFVRTTIFKQCLKPPVDARDCVIAAAHILNTVDIPLGEVREKQAGANASTDYTQWIVIKDMKNKILYYRSYHDLTLRSISLAALDLSSHKEYGPIQIEAAATIEDITSRT